jgi:sugar phosphate isomerase/epimerase
MFHEKVPRRSFVKAAVLSAAGAALVESGAKEPAFAAPRPLTAPDDRSAAPAPPHTLRLGVASYSMRKFSLEKALEMTKALDTPYINLKSVHLPYDASPAEIAAARRAIEAAGLIIVGGGTITFETDTDDGVRRYFEYAKASGMPIMVSTCKPGVLPRVEKFARQYDIRVAIHNHGPEDKNFPSPYDVLRAVKTMDPRMGLCMDIGHTVRTGTDVVQAAADAGSRLLDLHAKDLRELSARDSQCIVGQGKIPIADLFRQLQTMGFLGCVNLEYEIDADDPLPGMKQSFAYMRGVLAGLSTS